jgi:quercetin dioxygenase-like cupin family protein
LTETVIRKTDAPTFGDDGTHITGYASPSRGADAVAAWRVVLDPGAASPPHETTKGEAFLVLAGTATFDVDGRRHEVGAGDAICVPPHTSFTWGNEHDEPLETVCCMAGGGKARIGDGALFAIPWAQ